MSKYVCFYSGGKDSTATIILAHEHNEPLDLIVFSEVMFDKNISGELPEHIDFINNVAFPLFESWGYKCIKLRSEKTYLDCFYHLITKENAKHFGKYSGFPIVGSCVINRDCKIPPINKWLKENPDTIGYSGIAFDETARLKRAKLRGEISLLEKYSYTEKMAYELCQKYNLLSPIYEFAPRGGCWFCPNAKHDELLHLRNQHPDLWKQMILLSNETNLAGNIFNLYTRMSINDWEELFQNEENQIRWF